MPKVNLSHFEAALLFSLLTSIVLGVVSRNTDREPAPVRPEVLRLVSRGLVRHRLVDAPRARIEAVPCPHEAFLHRDVWLPDERARLREGRGHAGGPGLLAGGHPGRSGPGALQHLQYPRQSRAKSLQPVAAVQEKRERQAVRSPGLRGAAGGPADLRKGAARQPGVRFGQLRQAARVATPNWRLATAGSPVWA